MLPLLFFSSCDMALRFKDQLFPSNENSAASDIPVSSLQNTEQEKETVQTPTIILMKGNYLVHGIPCFGENAIQAIKGEYKIELPDNAITQDNENALLGAEAWLTSEFIYLSPDEWMPRNSLQNLRAMEKQNDEGLYIVSGFSGSSQEKWTIVFSIPQATLDAEINNALINRMIQNWTSRLSYYISNSQNENQISLPAVIEF
jgi:hypothetical protein